MLSPDTRQRIERTLADHRVVLFMKGDRQSPRCGFSAKAVGILDALIPDYASVDVLSDAEIREGIKEYGQWPTIPQLYVGGELVPSLTAVSRIEGISLPKIEVAATATP